MRVLVACKRGNVAERSKSGHCLCADCQEFRAAYRKANPRTEYKKEWRAKNPEKAGQYSKKWIEANKERRRQIEAAWKAANPEKVAAYNAKAGAKWARENKGHRIAIVRARQAAKKQRTPRWADLEAITAIYKESARLTAETGIAHEVDHFYPLQGKRVSGLHVHQNLRILTRTANRSKGNSLCEF